MPADTPAASTSPSLEPAELEQALEAMGAARFHAGQIYRWIHRRGVTDLDKMTDLSRELRAALKESAVISTPKIARKDVSADGTTKYLLELEDGALIESVFIPDTPSQTFCISSQVGCAMRLRLLPDRQDGHHPQPDGRRNRRRRRGCWRRIWSCSIRPSTS